jgi:cytochrome b pre-mRNA-processing protein 3
MNVNFLGFIRSLFPSGNPEVEKLFNTVLNHTREPVFYKDLEVPDSLDGRFDLLSLNCYLAVNRLNKIDGIEGKKMAHTFIERLYKEFERTSRDIGISDVSVGKQVRKMTQAYYGRVDAYDNALKTEDNGKLGKALTRNVYAKCEVPVSSNALVNMVAHVQQSISYLEHQVDEIILNGEAEFLLPVGKGNEQ